MSARKMKAVLFWLLGSVSLLLAMMIAGNAEIQTGVTPEGFLVAIIISFILVMVGGLLWISVSIALKKSHDDIFEGRPVLPQHLQHHNHHSHHGQHHAQQYTEGKRPRTDFD